MVLDWCHGFYNHQRRHSTIAMVSPLLLSETRVVSRQALVASANLIIGSRRQLLKG